MNEITMHQLHLNPVTEYCKHDSMTTLFDSISARHKIMFS